MNVMNLLRLDGRVAVVTGGAGIYGAPITEALAEAGAHVVIASRSAENCRRQSEALKNAGYEASVQTYDQSDEASILGFRDKVLEEHQQVDVFVNNAVGRFMSRYEDPLQTWRDSMEVNSTGSFATCRAFLEPMMERGAGSLIQIGSIQGVVAPDFCNYENTDMTTPPDYQFHKAGLLGLTRYLAAWAGPRGVRVNMISPGGFDTGKAPRVFVQQYCRRVFLGRMAQHDDIKGAVVFLASDASAYVTGENLIVDGGYCC